MSSKQSKVLKGRMDVHGKKLFAAAVLALTGLTGQAHAEEGWVVKLQGSIGGAVSSSIGLGEFPDALDGFDARYDGPAYPGSAGVNLYFDHSDWGRSDTLYWYDLKSLAPLQQWEIDVSSRLTNQSLTIEWDLARLPVNYILTLTDPVTGMVVDMRADPAYSYTNTGPRKLLVTAELIVAEEPVVAPAGPGQGKGPDRARLPESAQVPESAGSGKAYGL